MEHDTDRDDVEKKLVLPPSDLPPEEGVKGWLCVVGSFFVLFGSFGFLNAVGVFQSYYQRNYLSDYTPSDISWIFSFQLMSMWAPGPLFGRLTDTYGPSPVLYPCSILCVFALCMTSLATEYYQIFLAQGVAFGIGAGGVFTSSFICVGQWFVKRRGFAIGIASVGSSAGGVAFPLFLDKVIEEVGFAGGVRYTALLIGIVLAIGCLLVTPRLPRKKWDSNAKWLELALFKEPQFAMYTFGAFCVMSVYNHPNFYQARSSRWAMWEPFDYISSFALTQGFSNELALALICIINATSIPGRVVPTYLADKIGHFNIVTLSGFFIGLSILCLWIPFDFHPSHVGIIIFSLVYGFVSGAFVSLLMPCVAKTGPLETMGMRFGTFQLAISIACLTGLPISGAILARQGESTYWGLQTFAVVSAMLGSALTLASTILIGRTKGTWKV
ncbi:MFS general substrate transporter [Polychaeton citri CBS 116435]|uniref:MFS general substrate transporter n=1 Tax=Polychaeton citri CBS 116435 TaxID=1314669 RepID=A0A9P4QJW8_9PEZI|nr:MFS general substrate transporter [Polychaeton citri CBS 116435]